MSTKEKEAKEGSQNVTYEEQREARIREENLRFKLSQKKAKPSNQTSASPAASATQTQTASNSSTEQLPTNNLIELERGENEFEDFEMEHSLELDSAQPKPPQVSNNVIKITDGKNKFKGVKMTSKTTTTSGTGQSSKNN